MPRYINADKLSEEISQTYIDNDSALSYRASFDGDTLIGKMQVIDIISEQPTADVQEVRHGKWIERKVITVNKEEWQSAKCSVCGKYHTTPYMYYFSDYDYCPNCGAKMDEIEEWVFKMN